MVQAPPAGSYYPLDIITNGVDTPVTAKSGTATLNQASTVTGNGVRGARGNGFLDFAILVSGEGFGDETSIPNANGAGLIEALATLGGAGNGSPNPDPHTASGTYAQLIDLGYVPYVVVRL